MSNQFEKICDKASAFISRIFLLNSPSWRIGVAVGMTTSALLNIFKNWNFNLSFMINTFALVDRLTFSVLTPPYLIAEHDLYRINLFRKLYTILPNCKERKMKTIEDINIPSPEGHAIPATVYTPVSQVCAEIKRPIVIHMHGGGFVIGDVPMYAPITTSLASHTGFIVVGIEYRLAPEHKFPAAHHDCLTAVKWIHENAASLGGDTDKIAVIGDSAGGNLAASMACELPEIVKLSVPVYPVIKFGVIVSSKVENYNMPVLPSVMMDWFSNRYFSGSKDLQDPLVCPLLHTQEQLAKVPRTHVITAQYDVLRDEGLAYVRALRDAGVEVTHKNYDNTVHGFYGNATMTHGMQALVDTAVIIRSHFT